MHYIAPEMANNEVYRGDLADIWSAGVVLFVMIAGHLPFPGETAPPARQASLRARITECDVEWLEDDPFTSEARDLLCRVFVADPEARITGEQIWEHALLQKYEHYAHDPRLAETWIGGPPEQFTAGDCGKRINPETVDQDILRTMCVLWYTPDEEKMVARVTSEM